MKIGGMELDRIVQLFRALENHRVEYVVVGAVAINLHGLVRGTDDLDLFVRPSAENVERVRHAFRELWTDPEIDGIRIEDLAGEYPLVRYGPPQDEVAIDLIARLGTAFAFDDLEFQTVDFHGVSVRVVTPACLYRMKRGTLRLEDQRDADRLQERFGVGGE